MEAQRPAPDQEEMETLTEMVSRILRLHSSELNPNRSKLTTSANHDSGEDLHAGEAIERSWR